MKNRIAACLAALTLFGAPLPSALAQEAPAAAPAPTPRPKAQPKRNARQEATRQEAMRQEAARREACAQAAQNAANTAVGTAILGDALDIAGASTWGRGGWALSAAGNTVANTGAAAAQGEINTAAARHGC